MSKKLSRRAFLQSSAALAYGTAHSSNVYAETLPPVGMDRDDLPNPKAKSMILVWLPGGVSQNETWDPKPFTPFDAGMKGSHFKNTCGSIPTSVDGVEFCEGLENMASVMHHGTLLRSLNDEDPGSPSHPKYIYQVHTGYKFPAGFKAPSMGSIFSRTLGPLTPNVPAYIDVGRLTNRPDPASQFLNEVTGPGFYGYDYAPFVIPDAMDGFKTLNTLQGMTTERLDARLQLQQKLQQLLPETMRSNDDVDRYTKLIREARTLMDSPAKKAFQFMEEETPETLRAYGLNPKAKGKQDRFRSGCLLARRLVEQGARFVEVEFPFLGFGHFDTHAKGGERMADLRERIDKPIAQLIRDLDERGLLDTTMVVVMSEFGRTLGGVLSDGQFTRELNQAVGTPEARGENIRFDNTDMYGFHGHLRTWSALFYGAGIKRGHLFGKTQEEHPMIAIEDPVTISDVHATIYELMGLPPNLYYITENRPVYITNNGEGKPIRGIMA